MCTKSPFAGGTLTRCTVFCAFAADFRVVCCTRARFRFTACCSMRIRLRATDGDRKDMMRCVTAQPGTGHFPKSH